jgi:alpha/beta superfamily hydrolase
MTDARTCTTSDGLRLEAEYAAAVGDLVGAAVLCHPHPQYGGTMRSLVTSALFSGLPPLGIACLRFNFRGVEASEGEYADGTLESLDVVAAVDELVREVGDTPMLALLGWSFGGDIALTVTDERIDGWLAIAPPLRFRSDFDAVASDARPKLFVLGANDEVQDAHEVQRQVAGWTNTRVEIVPGASHFFMGRTDRVVAAASEFFDASRAR